MAKSTACPACSKEFVPTVVDGLAECPHCHKQFRARKRATLPESPDTVSREPSAPEKASRFRVEPTARKRRHFGRYIGFGAYVLVVGGILWAVWFFVREFEKASEPPVMAPADAPTPIQEKWAEAMKEAVTIGPMKIEVVEWFIGPADLKGIGDKFDKSTEEFTVIRLRLTNTDDAKTIIHQGWSVSYVSNGSELLAYDQQVPDDVYTNFARCSRVRIGDREIRWAAGKSQSVLPKSSIDDAIAFMKPPSTAKSLHLNLQARHFGLDGRIMFRLLIKSPPA